MRWLGETTFGNQYMIYSVLRDNIQIAQNMSFVHHKLMSDVQQRVFERISS